MFLSVSIVWFLVGVPLVAMGPIGDDTTKASAFPATEINNELKYRYSHNVNDNSVSLKMSNIKI